MTRAMFFYERFLFVSGRATWNVALAVRLRGPLSSDLLRHALAAIQSRHPQLCAGVDIVAGRPWFVTPTPPPPIPLLLAARCDDDTWLEKSWSLRARPFPMPGGPLARLLWIHPEADGMPSELVLVCHHCICDGTSLVMIMRELLCRLADPSMPATPLPTLGALTDLVRLRPRRRPQRLRQAAIAAAARLLLPATRLLPRRARGADHLRRWTIDQELVAALRRRCRAERTTVTAALAAALLEAFRDVRQAGARNRLLCPIDMRPMLPSIGREHLFPLADALILSIDLAPGFWPRVRALRARLVRDRDRLDPATRIATAERVHAVCDRLVDLQLHGRVRQDAALVDLGNLRLPDGEGPLALESVLGGFGVMPWRDATGVYTVRDKGRISMILVSREDLLSRDEAAQIGDRMIAILACALTEDIKFPTARPPFAPDPAARDLPRHEHETVREDLVRSA